MAEIAKQVGVGRSTLTRWETGENAPPSDEVRKLAEILGVPRVAFSREPRIV